MKPETRIAELEQHIASLKQDLNDAHNGLESATEELRTADARIRELEAKLAMADTEVTRLAVAVQPVETIDGDEFNKLLEECGAYEDNECSFALVAKRALIAHIDARLAAATINMQYAARYRWLRARTVAWNALRDPEWKTGDKLDGAIDAAMSQTQKGG